MKSAISTKFPSPTRRISSLLMVFLMIASLLPLIAITIEPVLADPDWLEGWGYRMEITIDHTKVDADLDNFPVLVYLDSTYTDFWSHCDSEANIAFTLSDGTTKLKREIELFDHTNDNLYAHMKIPDLSSTVDTKIYIYYDSASHEQTNDADTWDANFVMVQHMDDHTTSSILDSTIYKNDGTKKAPNEPIEVDGKIGKAQDFNKSDNEYVDITSLTDLSGSELTIEAWVKGTDIQSVVRQQNGVGYIVLMYGYGGANKHILSNDGETTGIAAGILNDNSWEYVVMTWKQNTANGFRSFHNEALVAERGRSNTPIPNINVPVELGRYRHGSGQPMDGIIDEVRISDTARSAAWIKTTFNNQSDPASFYSVGSEETTGAAAPEKPVLLMPENDSHTPDNTPTFTWTGGSDADNHRIEVDNDSDFLSCIDNVTVIGDNQWTKPPPGYVVDNYYWRVWAVNAYEENCSENTWAFEVIIPSVPPGWQLVETWAGTVSTPAAWNLIEALESAVDNLHDRVGVLENEVGTLENELETLRSRVATLENDTDNLLAWVGALETEVAALRLEVSGLRDNISVLDARISALEVTMPDVPARISELENAVAANGAAISSLESRATDLEFRVTVLEGTVADHEERIAGLENQMVALESDVDNLMDRVGVLKNEVGTLETELGTLSSRVDALETDTDDLLARVGVLGAEVDDLQIAVSGLESDILALDARISELDATMSDLENRISKLESEVADHETRISSLEFEMANLGYRVGLLETTVELHEARISSLENQIVILVDMVAELQAMVEGQATEIAGLQEELANFIAGTQLWVSSIENRLSELGVTDNTLWGTIENVKSDLEGIELTPGPQGPKGSTGDTGPQGPQGSPGSQGSSGITLAEIEGLESRIEELETKLNELLNPESSSGTLSAPAGGSASTSMEGTPVTKVTVSANLGCGITGSLKVQILNKLPPGLATVSAPEIVYNYLDISSENIAPGDVERITIEFRVERAWAVGENIDEGTIALCRYDASANEWITLPTEKIGEAVGYLYFSAESPGLSVFAITGSKLKPYPWALVLGAIVAVVLIGAVVAFYRLRGRPRERPRK